MNHALRPSHFLCQYSSGLGARGIADSPYFNPIQLDNVQQQKTWKKFRKGDRKVVYLRNVILKMTRSLATSSIFSWQRPGIHKFCYEWASWHVSASFRAPELWDCPSQADIDKRKDVSSLGCTLYAIMIYS